MNNVRTAVPHKDIFGVYVQHTIIEIRNPSVSLAQKFDSQDGYRTIVCEKTHLTALESRDVDPEGCRQLIKQCVGVREALTAPPTSYNNQFMVWPPTLISNECSDTPSVCILTFKMSSVGMYVSSDQGSK